MSSKSLKAEYAKWLWAVVTVDLLAMLALIAPATPATEIFSNVASWRLVATAVIPVVVLLLVNVPSHKMKCMLVYWKPYGRLPGCEVFTKYAPADPRVSMASLKKNVGPLPTDPAEQNARWYQLYKQVENEAEVSEAQKSFLMYRDLAVLSLALMALAPSWFYFAGAPVASRWIIAGIFFAQYLATAISGSNYGKRFVVTVVALHSARKITARARK